MKLTIITDARIQKMAIFSLVSILASMSFKVFRMFDEMLWISDNLVYDFSNLIAASTNSPSIVFLKS